MSKLIGTDEVSQLLGVSPATLRVWRSNNTGPASFKLGGKVVYETTTVHQWIERQKLETTRGES